MTSMLPWGTSDSALPQSFLILNAQEFIQMDNIFYIKSQKFIYFSGVDTMLTNVFKILGMDSLENGLKFLLVGTGCRFLDNVESF